MNENIKRTIDEIEKRRFPENDQWKELLLHSGAEETQYLAERADAARRSIYGNKVYLRGLIEITNYCKNDCYYCGIRKSNDRVQRYRLTPSEISDCCKTGYDLGIRTFVLQGGEDPYWTDEKLIPLIQSIKADYPDCAITLSLGERSKKSYQALYKAGADRYLLRHESANWDHYESLHPEEMDYRQRRACILNLKSIGFQMGCGFMVGSPGQTLDHIIEDLRYIGEICPAMVGIGPFMPATGTPFENEPAGSSKLTMKLLSIIRLIHPDVLLPATTALAAAKGDNRIQAIKAGANVIMPNLTPASVRDQYCIYDNKSEAAETADDIRALCRALSEAGFEAVTHRGDHPDYR